MQKTKIKSKPKASKRRAVVSAQQTIPYVAMHPDGICQLPGGLYTKTVEYEDINYAVASTEELNVFDLTILDIKEDTLRASALSFVFKLHIICPFYVFS